MIGIFGWVLRFVFVATMALTLVVVLKWSDIERLLAVNVLFDEENILHNFSNMDSMFFNTKMDLPDVIPASLPASAQAMPDGMGDWVEDRSVTAVVVLKDGMVAHEEYFMGTGEDDLRISWSVAKSFLSALLGIVVAEGDIESIDDPVVKYVPELIGSGYEHASIRNVLNMASGVTFDEDYLDFNSDINKMGRVLAMGGKMDDFAAGLIERNRPAGEAWQYVSIDTHIIGMVVRGATGRSIPDLLTEKILTPLQLESDPVYLTDGSGVAFVLGGLNMPTRDYARFGQMFIQNGEMNGTQIVPADWVAASTVPSAPTAAGGTQYGFQWWMASDATEGEYFARGIYGQYIYINQPAGVVIAANSVDRQFREAGSFEQNLAMFRAITASLN